MKQISQQLSRQPAQVKEPDKQELVVIVHIWLKYDQFSDTPKNQRPGHDPPVPPRKKQEPGQQKQKHPSHVLDIKPEIAIHLIGPVQVQAHHAAFSCLTESKTEQLGSCQQNNYASIQGPSQKPFFIKAGAKLHQTVNPAENTQSQKRMGMKQRQTSGQQN